jgi:FtsH-binding integral membrane protein
MESSEQMEGVLKTSDSKKKQIAINEWNYNDKMETLFTLQLLFIAFAVTIILLSLSNYGFFSRLFALYTGIVLVGIALLIGLIRRMYTNNVRSKKHWNQRVFSGDHSFGSLVPPAVLAATSTANKQICDAVNGTQSSTNAGSATASATAPATVSCP